ncbi:dihydrodipicolinate synthase family protein [Nonomuraea sp. NPDC046570]|uniref:dihydrodipicolinate synthase family protein n=1 Tax=Nonomuraea sp. NPDC046570 TaxID=3155255 RepID=UPI00340B6728
MSLDVLREGAVIPAHPLALTEGRRLDERRQRALTRYYLAAGAGGLAVGVHTTQFEIRRAGLLRPVLELAAEVVDAEAGRPVVKVAGACGGTAQAVAEAELAASLGYHAVLLSPVVPGADEEDLLARAKAVGEVLPTIGFYLQPAIGGPSLSRDFWRRLADQPSTVAVKLAPFDRYRTLEAVHGIVSSGRGQEVALYTGNDDHILGDLLGEVAGRRFAGGLLGQWAVWTRAAVRLFDQVRAARSGDTAALASLVGSSAAVTDANAAVFDAAHGFRGCIAGVHEVLRRQGLLAGVWCLDPAEGLSEGQADELTRVCAAYPWLTDDAFVAEHLDHWLR